MIDTDTHEDHAGGVPKVTDGRQAVGVGALAPDSDLSRLIVTLATWASSLFWVVLVSAAVLTRDPGLLTNSLAPLAVATSGWFMLRRGRNNAAAHLAIGMAAFMVTTSLTPEHVPGDPMLSLLVMGLCAVALSGRRALIAATGGIAAVIVASLWWSPPSQPVTHTAVDAAVAAIAFGLAAGLILCLRVRSDASRSGLEELVRSKDEFVATVSHELRTPLTTIRGLALELGSRFDEFTRAELEEFIDLLVAESGDVVGIVEDLLVAARAEIGTLALRCEALDVRGELAAALVDEKAITIDFSALPRPSTVFADELRLRQIVRNLVTNAQRHGGSRIRVVADTQHDAVHIEVRDDGTPIPPADRDRIFDPYQRSERLSGVPGSTGLGLTVSRRLARLMGGDVTYAHDGTESVFTATLPIADLEPVEASSAA